MPRSDSAGSADDALHRLVRAMMGHDDGVATSLAQRVLHSQIGREMSNDRQHDLSSTWRRISRKATDPSCRADMEGLYSQFERQCRDNNNQDDNDLPPKLLTVLTKLMGKHIRPATNVVQPTTTPKQNSVQPRNQPHHHPHHHQPKTRVPVVNNERQIREEKLELETEEALLLRECLYSLQGIDGERIRYYHKDSNLSSNKNWDDAYDGIRIQSPALTHSLLYTGRVLETRLGSGAMDALRVSGEAGWLYNRIQSYIHEVQQDESKGVVARAFAGTLAEELREYHSLLTQYESKLADLTLRQLLVDLRMPTSRLKILALLTDGLRHLSGGHLLSALHQHSLHGDTRHANLVQTILVAASRPWFDILHLWTTQGVLSDPHGEFFVTEDVRVDDKHLWKDKYCINKDQIPVGILETELVEPAFNVGKGINFIRRCLHDGKWTMQLRSEYDDDTDDGLNGDLGYRYKPYVDGNPALEKTLLRANNLVHTHILKTLKVENHMMEHFFALKQFLFLGQGDFFSALMEGLHTEFSGGEPGVAGIYKHSLLAIVEGALRSTNAKYLPQYVLDRLQVELVMDPDDEAYGMFGPDRTPGAKNDDRRTVWDIFMLDYQIPDPLLAIVHSAALDKYKMVFSLLFGLKKVEFMLNFTWRQSATLQHGLHTYAQYNRIPTSTSKGYTQASLLLRQISILRQSMIHLIVNLKSYLMFEVLEGGWRRLESEIEAAITLDEVIEAHDRYLNGIVRKSLLRTDMEDIAQQQLAEQVQTLLGITGEFCDLQERLFHDALVAADIAAEKRVEADRRVEQGRWGFDSEQDITEEEDFFGLADRGILRQVVQISEIYNQNALDLLRVLGEKVNGTPEDLEEDQPDLDWEDPTRYGMLSSRRVADLVDDDLDPQRFLIAQLDHNNYYGAQAGR
jgi:gamma-tubulin complex component 3